MNTVYKGQTYKQQTFVKTLHIWYVVVILPLYLCIADVQRRLVIRIFISSQAGRQKCFFFTNLNLA